MVQIHSSFVPLLRSFISDMVVDTHFIDREFASVNIKQVGPIEPFGSNRWCRDV